MHMIPSGCALAALLVIGCWGPLFAEDWKAPAEAAAIVNPLEATPEAIHDGGTVYRQSCAICHGAGGKGDGTGGAFLTPKPTNLANPALGTESDGSLFWKITNGRTAMPAYKAVLSDQQRWQTVIFLRTLSPRPAPDGVKRP